ncbi:hypothetical protein JOB18_039813 [Solea senegalensis]|uniref:Uncharacterized protein n=1 Tax=Solea senegalensis TaxID=28829 RepID=A0AAV6PTE9_SOLSE|nr:hypothetical protein JOB18_039813 [Solea senegalensis]
MGLLTNPHQKWVAAKSNCDNNNGEERTVLFLSNSEAACLLQLTTSKGDKSCIC